ncbi:hypothetical protein VCUG_02066 [Vavraia culicis subsp. floridensis]|uniref:Uncharacterized protein n=1 Tax=Vavraia culicis (isolate floridensis) TaxID=948595 RepID=L2GTL7_VAVCU|nr:uncharacterized protein VCUG_02066 [Vavraia culicis subsp. floridensis]ELA46430.1 hypothetical protein VCUG_02066 [Vavraia culicis subsp. floridensis]
MQEREEVHEQVARYGVIRRKPRHNLVKEYLNSLFRRYKYSLKNPKVCILYFLIFVLSIVLIKICVLITRILIVDFSGFSIENIWYDAIDKPEEIGVSFMSSYLCPVNVHVKNLKISICNDGTELIELENNSFSLEKNSRLGFSDILKIVNIHASDMLSYVSGKDITVKIRASIKIRFFFLKFACNHKCSRIISPQRSKNTYMVHLTRILLNEDMRMVHLYFANTGHIFAENVNIRLPEVILKAAIFGQACDIALSPISVTGGRMCSFVKLTLFFKNDFNLNALFMHSYKLITMADSSDYESSEVPIYIEGTRKEGYSSFERFFHKLKVPVQSWLSNMGKSGKNAVLPRFNLTCSTEGDEYAIYIDLKTCISKREINLLHMLYNSNLVPIHINIHKYNDRMDMSDDFGQEVEESLGGSENHGEKIKQGNNRKSEPGKKPKSDEKRTRHEEGDRVETDSGADAIKSSRGHFKDGTNGRKLEKVRKQNRNEAVEGPSICTINIKSYLNDVYYLKDDSAIQREAIQTGSILDSAGDVRGENRVRKTRALFKISFKVKSWNKLLDSCLSGKTLFFATSLDCYASRKIEFLFNTDQGIFFPNDKPGKTQPVSFLIKMPKIEHVVFTHRLSIKSGLPRGSLTIESEIQPSQKSRTNIQESIAGVEIIHDEFVKCENINTGNDLSLLSHDNRELSIDLQLGIYKIHMIAFENMLCYDGDYLHIIFRSVSKISLLTNEVSRDGPILGKPLLAHVAIGGGKAEDYRYLLESAHGDPFYYGILNRLNLKIEDISESIRITTNMEDILTNDDPRITNIITVPEKLVFEAGYSIDNIVARVSVDLNDSEIVYKGEKIYFRGQKIDVTPDFSNLVNQKTELSFFCPTDSIYHEFLAPWFETFKYNMAASSNGTLDANMGLDPLLIKAKVGITGFMAALGVCIDLPEKCVDQQNEVSDKSQLEGLRVSWPDMEMTLFYNGTDESRQSIIIWQIMSSYICLKPFGRTNSKSFFCQKKLLKFYLRVFSAWKPSDIGDAALQMEFTCAGKKFMRQNLNMKNYLKKFIESWNYGKEPFFIFQLVDFIINGNETENSERTKEQNSEKIRFECSHTVDYGSFDVELVHKGIINSICRLLGFVGNLNLGVYPRMANIKLESEQFTALEISSKNVGLIRLSAEVKHLSRLPIKYDQTPVDNNTRLRINVLYKAYISSLSSNIGGDEESSLNFSSNIRDLFKKTSESLDRGALKLIPEGDGKSMVTITLPMPMEIVIKKGNWPYIGIVFLLSRYHVYLREDPNETTFAVYVRRLPYSVKHDRKNIFLGLYGKDGVIRVNPVKCNLGYLLNNNYISWWYTLSYPLSGRLIEHIITYSAYIAYLMNRS